MRGGLKDYESKAMTFGPYKLKNSYISGSCFILELADADGNVLYRPKRFVSFSGHDRVYRKAKQLEGHFVTTQTSNPRKNPPEDWWIDVDAHGDGSKEIEAPSRGNEPRYTDEQLSCIEKFQSESHLKISAFAGTGKTTTLLGIANAVPKKKGLYLAFNKEIAEEARKKFPSNVECRTTHSFAYEFSSRDYTAEKLSGSLSPTTVADFLNLQPVNLGEHRDYSARQVGKWVVDTVANFCRSEDISFGPQHVSCGRLTDLKSQSDQDALSDFLLKCADYIWVNARNPNSPIPLGHDGYLKLWSISHPRFEHDFIMLDEAQDTNAAVIQALTSQNVQTVYVGDKYQQIYGFRGAFNAMDKIHVPSECALTTSFRFGESLAEVANALIGKFGETRKIVGDRSKNTTINTTAALTKIYRTNMGLLSGLADALKSGKKPYLAGGIGDLSALIYDVELMQSGQPAISNSDFFGFKNWHDLVAFSKTSEGGSYQTVVQIIETYGARVLKEMINRVSATASDADVILTTAHKSKGKEWAHVEVCDDFATSIRLSYLQQNSYSFSDPSVEEITLLYVALTRAEKSLVIPDSILDILKLSKYCRDPFSSLGAVPKAIDAPRIGSLATSNADLPEKPVLPSKFVRVSQAKQMTHSSGMALNDSGSVSSSISPSAMSLGSPQPPTSGVANNEKLQMLVSKFKK